MKVSHAKFGNGNVISDNGVNVTVDFNGDIKVLVIAFCKLSKEDGTSYGITFVAKEDKKTKRNKSMLSTCEALNMSKDDFEAMRERDKWASVSW